MTNISVYDYDNERLNSLSAILDCTEAEMIELAIDELIDALLTHPTMYRLTSGQKELIERV